MVFKVLGTFVVLNLEYIVHGFESLWYLVSRVRLHMVSGVLIRNFSLPLSDTE